MSEFAGELGVPADARLTEEASRSTHENAEFSAPLLRQRGVKRILVVTDRLHMRRAEGAFAAAGFEIERASVPVYASHPDNVSMLTSGFREYVALLYYRQRGWLAGAPKARTAERAAPDVTPIPVMLTNAVADERPVVILGASYAGGWKPARLGGHPVVNAGVAGEESWQMLARFDRDVVAQRPRAVILWGFINDIHRAPKDRVDQAVTKARESFVTMIARARAAGIEPILATELTIRPRRQLVGDVRIVGRLGARQGELPGRDQPSGDRDQRLAARPGATRGPARARSASAALGRRRHAAEGVRQGGRQPHPAGRLRRHRRLRRAAARRAPEAGRDPLTVA